ncbi:prostatic acid phosphatase-like isoform X2 [Plodia interpunctella]|nr:prostatic acid phosphatase-like isoform X2 [Plodia interpunctella]XP_053616564.1 prostatic acid phosphatase-like isoform X2 [Plodia interpunctella]XP_053616565.1 prostatic acid phosphatase-like isoform X2 [Plodia interpunctella]XP_053616566.1 prostatic acid phosphatase-like isoform X2 [Plodia interpunctella]XP_053616567.1 prostatic acid phosphatase-like isoform X2 [Plodia interpunctella]
MIYWSSIVICHIVASVSAVFLEDTDLVMAFIVHRHGDRTPTKSSVKYGTDPQALIELTKPYGYGQLTEKGKRRAYDLGQHLRFRYDDLLGRQYNASDVYLRSTDLTRTKMTMLTALAAIYPPGRINWSDDINWTPVPYTTVPVKYDYNIAYLNCPAFINASDVIFGSFYPEFERYNEALLAESVATGQDIVNHPIRAYDVSDILDVQRSFGIPIPTYLEDLMPQIQAAAARAMDYIFEGENANLEAGVLLQEFFKYANLAISGNQTERIRIYSAHDYNVYAFQIVTQATPRQGVPKYASAYALELRRFKNTGQFIVLPVYLPQPGEQVIYQQIKGCGPLCDYNKFVQLNWSHGMNYCTWQHRCGFYKDFQVKEE